MLYYKWLIPIASLLLGIWIGSHRNLIAMHFSDNDHNHVSPVNVRTFYAPYDKSKHKDRFSIDRHTHPMDFNDLKKTIMFNQSGMNTDNTISSRSPRLLFMTASYTDSQLIMLQKVLDCMLDFCNSGWNVTVHISAANSLNYTSSRYKEYQERLYCMASKSYVPIVIENYDQIGFGLNAKHRIFMRNHLDDFDFYAYAEEDMLLTISMMRAYIDELNVLKRTFPSTWVRYNIGFLRFEYSANDAEKVSWEYMPDKIHIVNVHKDLGNYLVTNNLNQAIFIFAKEQVLDLQSRCRFLTDIGQNSFYRELRHAMDMRWNYISAGVSEWSSSFQHVLQCGMRRIIPVDHLQSFMIYHSSQKGYLRRKRAELLTIADWQEIVKSKSLKPISLREAYDIISQQYNLHLLRAHVYQGKSLFAFNDFDYDGK